jgi:16S rRNA (guanine1207-N2)-methyltransferase
VTKGHYFDARPTAAHRPGLVRVVLPDVYLELETDSGVFSPGRLDPGTRLLIEEAPPPPRQGDLLDLGCGYGPVACVLASRAPEATVWAVDVNERALDLTARNARRAGLSGVRAVKAAAVRPDDPPAGDRAAGGSPAAGPDVPGTLAAIWSNPPIRIGKPALHGMLRAWLARLAPDGSACLVVSRNLGSDSLHSWLAAEGWDVTRIAARGGYRLLRLCAPPGPRA